MLIDKELRFGCQSQVRAISVKAHKNSTFGKLKQTCQTYTTLNTSINPKINLSINCYLCKKKRLTENAV